MEGAQGKNNGDPHLLGQIDLLTPLDSWPLSPFAQIPTTQLLSSWFLVASKNGHHSLSSITIFSLSHNLRLNDIKNKLQPLATHICP
jgi:hypothetical protein